MIVEITGAAEGVNLAEWIAVIVVLHVLGRGETNLLQVALARSAPCILTRPLEHREQNGRQESYDTDNYEDFYECKTSRGSSCYRRIETFHPATKVETTCGDGCS